MYEAMFYKQVSGSTEVRCYLCNQRCKIEDGQRGLCGVRENQGGKLYSLVYGRVIAENVDPIEKKPLFHFQPGSRSFSIGTVGCNFFCTHCQNVEISQYPHQRPAPIVGEERTTAQIVAAARQTGCSSIAYTYTEPTIFYEMAYDTATAAHREGIKNVFVSNGYMSTEAAERIAPYLDAINLDLKSYSDDFYQEVCRARLKPVLQNIQLLKDLGVWLEVTTLVIPGLNDGEEELREIARFIRGVAAEVPWHVSRFHPAYQLRDRPSTPVSTLQRARQIGLEEGLHYVYLGNVPGADGEHTWCHGCGAVVIERRGLLLFKKNLQDDKCPYCGAIIAGVDMS